MDYIIKSNYAYFVFLRACKGKINVLFPLYWAALNVSQLHTLKITWFEGNRLFSLYHWLKRIRKGKPDSVIPPDNCKPAPMYTWWCKKWPAVIKGHLPSPSLLLLQPLLLLLQEPSCMVAAASADWPAVAAAAAAGACYVCIWVPPYAATDKSSTCGLLFNHSSGCPM